LKAFDRFTEKHEDKIKNDLALTGHDKKKLEDELSQHKSYIKRINSKLVDLLDSKADGFDILSHLMDQMRSMSF
jgi:hypothetical protein